MTASTGPADTGSIGASSSGSDDIVPELDASGDGGRAETASHLRGSSLLLLGRVLSMVANVAIQVLIVRHLSKTDYGLFAYALQIAVTVATLITLGLDRGLSRFVAIYEERGLLNKMWGVIAMQVISIVGLGVAAIGLVVGLRGWVAGTLLGKPSVSTALAVIILLAPVQALDDMTAALFAVFGRSKTIFVRRYLLAPGLKLAVVLLLVGMGGGIVFLAAGYVLAGLLGLAVYGRMLSRVIRERHLLAGGAARNPSFPIREVLTFTLPLVATDIMFVLLNTSDVVILSHTASADVIGSYRAVLPVARTNTLVMNSFALLFAPLMARLWARGDRDATRRLYWGTAAWVAVLSFPGFALSFGLARPATLLLFGDRYAGSASYLQILALAFFFNASLGFNGVTLKMLGHVKYVASIAVTAAVVNIGINLVLIPRYGAMGAAVGTAISIFVYNLLKQCGLRLGSGIPLFERRYLPLYATIVVSIAVMFGVQQLSQSAFVLLPLAAVSTLAVVAAGRHELDVNDTFPELARLPLIGGWLVGRRGGG